MDCKGVQSRTIDYLLDDVDTATQPEITEHLGQCQVCTRAVREFKSVDQCLKDFVGQFPPPQVRPRDGASRVYRKIRLEQQRFKRHLIYKVVATAAVVLIGLVSYLLFTTSPSHVFEGTLYVETKGEESKVLESFDSLPIGQTLKTKEGQSAKIKLRDSSIIKMSPDTILTLKHDSRLNGRVFNLEQGELKCQVVKGRGFRIQMPGAELKTLGTEFVVRTSTNRKEITTSQNKLLSFITSATVKVAVSSGKVSLTISPSPYSSSLGGEGRVRGQEIKAGETVIRDVNPLLPLELQAEIKNLINQLGNENVLIQEKALAKLVEIGYVSMPYLEETVQQADLIQQPYINRLLERFSGPKILWSHEIPNIDFALHPPVVSNDNQLYVVDKSGLYALDYLEGSVNWKFQRKGLNSPPLSHEGVIYIGTLDGNLYALDSKEGKIIWQQPGLNGGIQSTPAVFNHTVYIGVSGPYTNRGKFYALDAETGKIKWMNDTIGIITGSQAVIYNNMVVVGSWDHKLYALNAQTGETIWDYQTNGKITTKAIISDDLVYYGSADGQLYALFILDGQKQWSFQADSAIIESPVKKGNMIYFGTEHKVYAFDLKGCTVKWTYNREKTMLGEIITVVKEKVYLGTDGGEIIALDAITGQELWRYGVLDDKDSATYFCNIAVASTVLDDVLFSAASLVGRSLIKDRVYAFKLER